MQLTVLNDIYCESYGQGVEMNCNNRLYCVRNKRFTVWNEMVTGHMTKTATMLIYCKRTTTLKSSSSEPEVLF